MEKKSKIGKIENFVRVGNINSNGYAIETVDVEVLKEMAEKVNEIIDHLNTQPQTEEKPVVKENLTTENPLEDTPEEWREQIKDVIENKTPYEVNGMSKFEIVEWIVDELLNERELEVWKEALSKLKDK